MGKGEAAHTKGAIRLFYDGATYPVTPPVPGFRLRNRGNGKKPFQRSLARGIFGVIVFLFPSSSCGKGFVFFTS